MPGIMLKALEKMLPSTKKMDVDDSIDDRDNNRCPQRDVTGRACASPKDRQNDSVKIDVKGAENSTVNNNSTSGIRIDHVEQMHVNKEEGTKAKGVTTNYVQGTEPTIQISVPAKEGETIIHVECTKDDMPYSCYRHYDGQKRPFRSKWIFKNVPHGLIKLIMKECPTFFELIGELEKCYPCKHERIHNKSCLVLEFLHDTEEERDRMMQDEENVKKMFMNFLHGIGKDAPICSLDVYSEPATASAHDEDVNKLICVNSRGRQLTDTSDSDSDSFYDATDKEDTEQVANPPATPLTTEDGKERIGLKDTSLTETSDSDSGSSFDTTDEEDTDGKERIGLKDTALIYSPDYYSEYKGVSTSSVIPRMPTLSRQMASLVAKLNCSRCDADYSERTKWHLTSLKSLVCRALRTHPLPASAIPIFTCTTCYQFWRDEKNHLQRYRSVFFIHLRRTSFNYMCQSAAYQFQKALSAIRNSGGGALIVHWCKNCFAFGLAIDPVLQTMLTDEEIITDGFRWHPKEIGREILYEIDVSPSDTIATADMKTKLPAWCGDKQVRASFDKVKLLMLSQRKVSTKGPSVQGLPHKKQTDAVKIYEDEDDYPAYSSVNAWVNHIMNDLSIPEYVTCMTKRKQGGSVYIVETSDDNEDDMGGISFPEQVNIHELQSILAEELQKKIHVFNNKYSGIVLTPKDVFQIEIHDTGRNTGVIEIAVRPVDGCVFHDVLGPASFRVEVKSIAGLDYDAIVRLSFDEWMKRSLAEVC